MHGSGEISAGVVAPALNMQDTKFCDDVARDTIAQITAHYFFSLNIRLINLHLHKNFPPQSTCTDGGGLLQNFLQIREWFKNQNIAMFGRLAKSQNHLHAQPERQDMRKCKSEILQLHLPHRRENISLLCVVILMSARSSGFCQLREKHSPEHSDGSGNVMTYVYHPPESALDPRFNFAWEVLRTALEKTKKKYGEYVLKPSEVMTPAREAYELENPTGKLSVMYDFASREHESTFVPVRIPVDKGLLGYCIFLINKEDQQKFDAVRSLNDLKSFNFGMGSGRIHVDILRENGFKVTTGSSYDGLFEMLMNKRFDALLRPASAVLSEYDSRVTAKPNLHIESKTVLYVPLPSYFYFAKNPAGKQLAARAEAGMRKMIADGTYDSIFNAYYGEKIKRLRLDRRRLFKIRNSFLSPLTPFQDKRLWFDPANYR